MADRILTICDKQGQVLAGRLLTATEVYLKQQTVAIHRLHGRAQLSKATELLATVLSINELHETYYIELRSILGLSAQPWSQEQSVENMKMLKERINKCA